MLLEGADVEVKVVLSEDVQPIDVVVHVFDEELRVRSLVSDELDVLLTVELLEDVQPVDVVVGVVDEELMLRSVSLIIDELDIPLAVAHVVDVAPEDAWKLALDAVELVVSRMAVTDTTEHSSSETLNNVHKDPWKAMLRMLASTSDAVTPFSTPA
mmetsp:Transcript_55924/g.125739  ORF Transcript_55924/g.125739 Transcript_55924/m.125739 type:complete len:156 (-) Transcript_55924:20-487(-)